MSGRGRGKVAGGGERTPLLGGRGNGGRGRGNGRGQPIKSGTKTTPTAKREQKKAIALMKEVEKEAKASGVPKPVAAIFLRKDGGPQAKKQFEALPEKGKKFYLSAIKREIKADPVILPSKLHRVALNEAKIQMTDLPPPPKEAGGGTKPPPKSGGRGNGGRGGAKSAQPASKTKR